MAATLPAINQSGSRVGMSPTVTMTINEPHHVPSPPSKPGSASRAKLLQNAQKRSQTKREREIAERKLLLRSQQPDLSKRDTAQYRNTYKHNLCVDMLKEGYHKSFAELFALIKQQNDIRNHAGPESLTWTMTLLENETDKLDILKKYLTQAESALRQENYAEVYNCQFELARYFQTTGDKWLADHFFENCLATARGVKGDAGKMAAEGHCNVGLALEESGDTYEAAENFEMFYSLCKGHTDWELEGGRPMHPEACNNLSRIYTAIAALCEKQQADNTDSVEQQLAYLKKAYDMAKEGGDRKTAGQASYKLGLAHEKHGESSTALHYLTNYLETCRTLEDESGMGKACEAIAKSYESEGKIEESIKYLEMFVEVSEKSKDEKAISRASSCLGAMFNSLGRYDAAVENFNKAYHIARSMNDKDTINASRVLFGVASAHKMLSHMATHVQLATKPCIERLIEWKDNRGDEFEKEIPKEETTTPAPESRENVGETSEQ